MGLARVPASTSSGKTHESNTTSNDQAKGGDAIGGGSTGSVWDGASSGSGGDTAGGSNGWGGNTGSRAGAGVHGDDTGMLLARTLASESRGYSLLGRCDSGHGGDGKGEDVELHFDGRVFVLKTV